MKAFGKNITGKHGIDRDVERGKLDRRSAQEAELERRLSSLDEGRRNGVTWASLKAELEQRCP